MDGLDDLLGGVNDQDFLAEELLKAARAKRLLEQKQKDAARGACCLLTLAGFILWLLTVLYLVEEVF